MLSILFGQLRVKSLALFGKRCPKVDKRSQNPVSSVLSLDWVIWISVISHLDRGVIRVKLINTSTYFYSIFKHALAASNI